MKAKVHSCLKWILNAIIDILICTSLAGCCSSPEEVHRPANVSTPLQIHSTKSDSLEKARIDSLDKLPKHPWQQTVMLKDQHANGDSPIVAAVTFQASLMRNRVSPGEPVMTPDESSPTRISFSGEEGFIRLKITKIDWSSCKDYDGSAEYKVLQKNLWTDMQPAPWSRPHKTMKPAQRRKLYITSPNIEFIKGDSLPPPTIFKVDRSGDYKLIMGLKAITPKTEEGTKPSEYNFKFAVEGLKKDELDIPLIK